MCFCLCANDAWVGCARSPCVPLPVSVRHQTAHDINLNVGEIVISLQASCYWLKPAATGNRSLRPFLTSHHQSAPPPPLQYIHLSISPFQFSCLWFPVPAASLPSNPSFLLLTQSLLNPSSLTSSLSCCLRHPPIPPSHQPLLLLRASAP